MKKFSVFLLFFFLVSFVGNIAVSLVYFDYFHQKNYDDFFQLAIAARNEKFDNNSLLLDVSTKVNEDDSDALLTELSAAFGDKLVGYAQMNNYIYGGERQGIRMVPKYLLDETYIPLTEGRMPDTTKTTADFAEVICLEGTTEIGKKIKLELQNEEETYAYNFMVVGTFSLLSYPLARSSQYLHDNSRIIVPPMKLSDGRNIVALPDCVQLTFANPEYKAEGEAYIKNHTEYGTMVKYTPYHTVAEDGILYNRSEMKKSLILAIFITVVLSTFLLIIQIAMFFKLKLKSGIHSVWIFFAMVLGSVLLTLVSGAFSIMGLKTPSDIPLKIGLISGIVSALVAFTVFWIRRAKNNDNN